MEVRMCENCKYWERQKDRGICELISNECCLSIAEIVVDGLLFDSVYFETAEDFYCNLWKGV